MESDNGTEIVADITIQRILGGSQQVVSHAGASQYAPGGVGASACGIASLNCVRVVFEKENDGLRDEALLKDVICRHTTEVRLGTQFLRHGRPKNRTIRKSHRYVPSGQANSTWKWMRSAKFLCLSGL